MGGHACRRWRQGVGRALGTGRGPNVQAGHHAHRDQGGHQGQWHPAWSGLVRWRHRRCRRATAFRAAVAGGRDGGHGDGLVHADHARGRCSPDDARGLGLLGWDGIKGQGQPWSTFAQADDVSVLKRRHTRHPRAVEKQAVAAALVGQRDRIGARLEVDERVPTTHDIVVVAELDVRTQLTPDDDRLLPIGCAGGIVRRSRVGFSRISR